MFEGVRAVLVTTVTTATEVQMCDARLSASIGLGELQKLPALSGLQSSTNCHASAAKL